MTKVRIDFVPSCLKNVEKGLKYLINTTTTDNQHPPPIAMNFDFTKPNPEEPPQIYLRATCVCNTDTDGVVLVVIRDVFGALENHKYVEYPVEIRGNQIGSIVLSKYKKHGGWGNRILWAGRQVPKVLPISVAAVTIATSLAA